MECKKSNSNTLSEEELFNAINNPSPETSKFPEQVEDIINFLVHFDIIEGKHIVTHDLLFKLYTNWSKKPLKKLDFTKYLRLYIPYSQTGKEFKINLDKFNITKQLYNYLAINKTNYGSLSPKVKQRLKRFQTAHNLNPGNYWLEFEVIFYLMDKWVYKNNSTQVISKDKFKSILNVLFEHRDIRKYDTLFRVYKVDEEILKHITQEEIEQILKGKAGFYGKKKNTK